MSEYRNVMVVGEVNGDILPSITAEILGCGRELADDLGEELWIAIARGKDGRAAQRAIHLGADRAYCIDCQTLEDIPPHSLADALERIVRQAMPRILLFGQTDMGRDLAPLLAFRLDTAATLDCIHLAIDAGSKLLLQTKPVYGGKAFATYSCPLFPQIATIRAKTATPAEPNETRQGDIIVVNPAMQAIEPVRTVEKVLEVREGVKLEDARIVISGGRGMGGAEGFRHLEELASLLKGAVGATRMSCDNGWAPDSAQIGLTGKIVSPDLYVAVAISGASQHLTGITGTKAIVAINRDGEANIFKEASFGIVGDWEKVLPAFTAKVKDLLSEA